jgi:malate synthase
VKDESGDEITMDSIMARFAEELANIKALVGEEAYSGGKYEAATELLKDLVKREDFVDFLTLPAYEQL